MVGEYRPFAAVVGGNLSRPITVLGLEVRVERRSQMKKTARSKAEADRSGAPSVLRSQFRSFAKLAEQAGDGRPLLRGLRVAQDPTAPSVR